MNYYKIEFDCGHCRFTDANTTIQLVKRGQMRYCKTCFEQREVINVTMTTATEVNTCQF